ncbi:MAG TPA: helix-turn-helix transcriptional regulator [Streptosporangiaceae bacterium]|nr:helix-turn-helix transcriptional regulator [Streptosporangiaceae bacterium]
MAAGWLGEYLRARRALVTPADAGLPATGRRRVPGLKRGEVAALAGISAEYYTRLEQGHDRHPSAQVLTAIARALRLDEPSTAHLLELAAPAPCGRRRPRPPERVPPTVARLLDTLPLHPAYVQGRYLDVLAANQLMTTLSAMYRPGTNMLRAAFIDRMVDDLFSDPETRLSNAVSGLRALAGPDVNDPQLAELVGELSVKSADFRRLWSRHDVLPQAGEGIHRLHHPVAGDLELRYDKFLLAGDVRQMLVVYQADPGSRSEEALTFLAASTARP